MSNNLRKAAVLIRSLDGDTAARLLGRLSPDEAERVRAAVRTLGDVDGEEHADIVAEFRRVKPLANLPASLGVELQLTSDAGVELGSSPDRGQWTLKRFDFLEQASVEALGQFLTREHVQTIAVVLSYLAPARAAAVLATLPDALQAETIERLGTLGETDPDSLTVVERELSDWLSKRAVAKSGTVRRDTVLSILAAADDSARNRILVSLQRHKAPLAKQLTPLLPLPRTSDNSTAQPASPRGTQADRLGDRKLQIESEREAPNSNRRSTVELVRGSLPPRKPAVSFHFDQVALLSDVELAAVVRDVEAGVLVLALAGSSEELLDRICESMPRRAGKAFRRQLSRLGPTRLSDVEAAQRLVAAAAERRVVERTRRTTTAIG